MSRVHVVRVNNLGQIFFPLHVVRVGAERKLLVSPVAAVVTDVAGIGLATAGFICADQLWVKLACFFGGLWMATALTTELVKLAGEDEATVKILYDV